jgi:hypothetical protein
MASSQPAPGLAPDRRLSGHSLTFFITQRDGVYRRRLMQADLLGVSGLAVAVGQDACHVASERPAAAAGSRLASGLRVSPRGPGLGCVLVMDARAGAKVHHQRAAGRYW